MPSSRDELRPEAFAIPFESLLASQKEGFRRLAAMLAATAAPAAYSNAPKGTASRYRAELQKRSRLAILSGGRGTGKTTAILSLIHSIEDKLAPETEETALSSDLNSLHDRLVWLDVLDMSPLPDGAKLFSAVLVRIEQAYKRIVGARATDERPRGILDEPEIYNSPLKMLQELQIDVAIAWEGILAERPGTLDVYTSSAGSSTPCQRSWLPGRNGPSISCRSLSRSPGRPPASPTTLRPKPAA